MTLHHLLDAPTPGLAGALAEFERQFTYPLGPGRTFRISHGDNYTRFFRAMGEASCFVMEESGRVLGVLCTCARRMILPDGSEKTVTYVGDLKVDPSAGGAALFLKLAWSALRTGPAPTGYGVVMDGTRRTPDGYTGTLGIPLARELGKVIVWQFRTGQPVASIDDFRSSCDSTLALYRKLSLGRHACIDAKVTARSEMTPVWLAHPSGDACGLVEDTRRCKRLIADDGTELRSGHLSYFAFSSAVAGAELIQAAIQLAGEAGHPAMFVAMTPADAAVLEAQMRGLEKVVAPATIYGNIPGASLPWNINSSEI
ncbi:MAG: hypothetical protein AB7E80_13305 [Hyphomicrobiaceae bacterium]